MKTYLIENLGCANCAAKIEDRISKLDGVTEVSLDLMGKKLYLNDGADLSAEFLTKLADQIESGVVIKDKPARETANKSTADTHHDHHDHHGEGCNHDHHDHHGEGCNHDHHDHHGEGCNHDHHDHHGEGCNHDHHDHHSESHNHDDRQQETGHDHDHEHSFSGNKILMIRLIISFALFLIAVFGIGAENIVAIVMLVVAFVVIGYDIFMLVPKNLKHGQFFDENLLMTIASTGAMLIGEVPEGVAVLIFYQLGEFLQHKAVDQSRRSIASQMDLRSERVLLLKNNQEILVEPYDLNQGDTILLKAHQLLPVDAMVVKGNSFMNTASITGESKPMQVNEGSEALSGFVNGDSELRLKVTAPYAESTTAKIIELVEHASSKKARAERFITKFARIYTPIVVALAVIVALFPPLFLGGDYITWIYRGLIFLVVSCPCALVLSIPLGFFAGLGAAAKSGIVVKGGNYLEKLSEIDTFVFDKTGTLTSGDFKVVDTKTDGITREQLLAIAKWLESKSNHPIAKAIMAVDLSDGDGQDINNLKIESFTEKPGYGVTAVADGVTYYAGNGKLMAECGIQIEDYDDQYTRVHIAKNQVYLGTILLADTVKPQTEAMLNSLKSLGVTDQVMVSGDKSGVVAAIAQKIGIPKYYGGALPSDKLNVVTDLIEKQNRAVAFVGDGSNDAPGLARADVGIAMGGVGTDVALEAADMMIMEDDILAIPKAIKISKKTKRIIYQNIALALGFKILVMVLSVLGFANMWLAVFADVGVAILAVLNSLRILNYRY